MLVLRTQHGVTLIELMIVIVVFSIVLALGMPSFSEWIQNAQIRTAAESVQNGLQLARNEAVRRNVNVRFDLTASDGTVAWTVGCVNTAQCPASLRQRAAEEGGGLARAGVSTATPLPAFTTAIASTTGLPAGVTFNGLGAVPSANAGTDITRIDITNSASATARRLVIVVSNGGLIRMCDPALSLSSNPQGCN
ncbi:MAG: GspH/FimT family pseudopilin [Pseudomonadota bacterium]